MNTQDLQDKIRNYPVTLLKRTAKVCVCCEKNKAAFYVQWDFRFRDYFCRECGMKADSAELLLVELRQAYRMQFQNGISNQSFVLWIESRLAQS